MQSRWFNFLLIGLALLLSAPLHAAWQSVVNGNWLGKRMPPLALETRAVQPRMLSGAADGPGVARGVGNDVTLVYFWAPWSVSCNERIPLLNALQATYRPQGLTVFGMAREPPGEVAEFARRARLDYAVGSDSGGKLFAQLGVRSMPYAVLVDRNGIVVWQGDPSGLRRATIETTLRAPQLGALVRF